MTHTLILLLTSLCLFEVGTNIYSLNNSIQNNLINIKLAIDPSEEKYRIEEFNFGYRIYREKNNELVEYSNESPSPYLDYDNDLVYGGPGYYLYKDNKTYVSTLDNNIVYNIDKVEKKPIYFEYNDDSDIISSKAKNSSLIEQYYVDNPNYFSQDLAYDCGYTDGGKCGYIGLGMMIAYADRYKNDNLMDDSFYNSSLSKSGLKGNENSIGEYLYNMMPKNGTCGWDMPELMSSYSKERNVTLTTNTWKLIFTFTNQGLCNLLEDNIPIELFGIFSYSYDGSLNNGYVENHAIVAYGCDVIGGKYYFKCHLGWEGYSNLYITSSTIGTIYYFDV